MFTSSLMTLFVKTCQILELLWWYSPTIAAIRKYNNNFKWEKQWRSSIISVHSYSTWPNLVWNFNIKTLRSHFTEEFNQSILRLTSIGKIDSIAGFAFQVLLKNWKKLSIFLVMSLQLLIMQLFSKSIWLKPKKGSPVTLTQIAPLENGVSIQTNKKFSSYLISASLY